MANTLALESEDIRKTVGHFIALSGLTLSVKRGEYDAACRSQAPISAELRARIERFRQNVP